MEVISLGLFIGDRHMGARPTCDCTIYKAINAATLEYYQGEFAIKLMEEVYLGTEYMNIIESLLVRGGRWHKAPFVMAGYDAPPEEGKDMNLYDRLHAEGGTLVKVDNVPTKNKRYRYMMNATKQAFVDTEKVKACVFGDETYYIHSLAILCTEARRGGAGDYKGKGPYGQWARDLVYVQDETPNDAFAEVDVKEFVL